MDFREIQYVLAIEKYQTLSGAARFLDITQPSLSKFLQNLENRLNVKLFCRIDNKMHLTYAGRQYVETGLKFLDLNHQLNNTLSDISSESRGSLSIGITPTRGRYVLPNVLPDFKRMHPQYKINIMEDGITALNQAMENGQIDLAIYTVSETFRPDLAYEKVCKEEIVLCISPISEVACRLEQRAGKKHPWLDINLLGQELFFLVDENFRTRKIADRILSASSIRPQTITLQSVETALSIVASGIGVSFCTDMCEKFFYTDRPLLYCSVGEQENLWDFVIAYRKDSYLSSAARNFIDITKNAFAGPPDEA